MTLLISIDDNVDGHENDVIADWNVETMLTASRKTMGTRIDLNVWDDYQLVHLHIMRTCYSMSRNKMVFALIRSAICVLSFCSHCVAPVLFCWASVLWIFSFCIGFVASALAFLAFVLVFGCQGAQGSQGGPSNTIRFLRFKLLHVLCNSSTGLLAYVLVC